MRHSSSSRVKMLMAFAWIKSMMPCAAAPGAGWDDGDWGLGMDWRGRTLGGNNMYSFYMFFFIFSLWLKVCRNCLLFIQHGGYPQRFVWVCQRNMEETSNAWHLGFIIDLSNPTRGNGSHRDATRCYQKQDRSTIDPSSVSVSAYDYMCIYIYMHILIYLPYLSYTVYIYINIYI